MIENFKRKINQLDKFALAVSGGADSICMTLLSYQLNLKPLVLIVDHKLRAESSDEATSVSKYINETFKFETKILTWNQQDQTKKTQSHARDARYDLLIGECMNHGIEHLLTAHNKNDQAETVLMNILRGSGIDGLTGIKELSEFHNVTVSRPMLGFTRDEIINHLNISHIKWIEDSSNHNQKYERVKVRSFFNTLEESHLINAKHLLNRLVLLAENVGRSRKFISNYVEKVINKICCFWPLDVVTIAVDQLFNEEEEVIFRILRSVLQCVGRQKYYVRLEKLMRFYNSLCQSYQQDNNLDTTLGGCMIWLSLQDEKIYLVISPENLRQNTEDMRNKNELKLLREFLVDFKNQDYIVTDNNLFLTARAMMKIKNPMKFLRNVKCINGEYPDLGVAQVNRNF